MTESSPTPRPKKTKKKKTKRVRNMSFESPGPSRVSETKTPQPSESAAPLVRTPKQILLTSAVPTPVMSPNLTADFTLGVEDLLDDLDQFSDDDFVVSSAPKGKIITPTASKAQSDHNKIINSVTNQQAKTFPPASNVLDLSKLAPNLSVSDLFNDTFDDVDPALLSAVFEAPLELSTLKPASLPVSSQFDVGVDDLIDDDFTVPILNNNPTNISIDIPCLKDRLTAKHHSINKTSSFASSFNKSNIPPKDWVPSQPGLDLALSSIEEPKAGPSNKPNTSVPIVILVNTKALSNNQICTLLRSRHGVMVEVVQGEAADYIISWSTAVIRIGLGGKMILNTILKGTFVKFSNYHVESQTSQDLYFV